MNSTTSKLLERYRGAKSPTTSAMARDALLRSEQGDDVTSDLLTLAALYCNEKDPGGNYTPLSILELLLDDYTNFDN